jgi:hypothetical protein
MGRYDSLASAFPSRVEERNGNVVLGAVGSAGKKGWEATTVCIEIRGFPPLPEKHRQGLGTPRICCTLRRGTSRGLLSLLGIVVRNAG